MEAMTGCYSCDQKHVFGPQVMFKAEVDGYERTEKLGIQLLIHHFTKQKKVNSAGPRELAENPAVVLKTGMGKYKRCLILKRLDQKETEFQKLKERWRELKRVAKKKYW